MTIFVFSILTNPLYLFCLGSIMLVLEDHSHVSEFPKGIIYLATRINQFLPTLRITHIHITMAENNLCFDPDQHLDQTLKAFNCFIECFKLRHDAGYPDPPRISMEAALQRWKITQQNPGTARPSIE